MLKDASAWFASAVLALAVSCAADVPSHQESTQDVAHLVTELHSRDPDARDLAHNQLRALPTSQLPKIKEIFSSEQDPEVKSRIGDVVRHLLRRNGDELYESGKIHDALLRYAESRGAKDPCSQVESELKEARELIIKASGLKDRFPIQRSWSEIIKVMKSHGRSGVWALFRAFESNVLEIRATAFRILRDLEFPEVFPPAQAALGTGPDHAKVLTCRLLANFKSRKALPILQEVSFSVAEADDVKESAREACESIASHFPKNPEE